MESKRDLFDIPRELAYLNTAYFGCFSNKTTETAVEAAKIKSQPWNITIPDFFKDAEKARKQLQKTFDETDYLVFKAP